MVFDEKAVIARVQAGDEAAFNLIMDQYQDRLFRLSLRLMRNKEDAEEVLMEAFTKAFFGMHKFRGDSSLFTWLYAITLKIAFKKRGRGAKHTDRTRPIDDMAADPVSTEVAADDASWHKEIGRQIDEAALRLPRAQRAVFVLRHQEELTFQEIANHLGKSEGGVKALYFHAVRKMRTMLAPVFGRTPRGGPDQAG